MVGLTESDMVYLLNHLKEIWNSSENYLINPNAFQGIRKTGEHYMFCCPVHVETRPSCGIMCEYPFGWNCFSCGSHGTLFKLVSIVIGCNELFAEHYLEKLFYFGRGIEPPLKLKSLSYKIDALINEKVLKTTGHTALTEEEGLKYSGIKHSYMYQRGFNNRAIARYELGYDEKTDSIVFPVRDYKGRIRFLQRRAVGRKIFFNDEGVYKKDILYGLYYIMQAPKHIDEIYMVESATDAIACYVGKKPAVALMGRIFFDEMIHPLKVAHIRKINLFLDNDVAGWDAMMKTSKKLMDWGFEVTLPKHICGYKDANELLIAGRLNEMKFVNPLEFTLAEKLTL